MAVVAFEDVRPQRPRLTDGEKALLFDLALNAGGFGPERDITRADALAAAPLIEAFARAYVTIRDREDGIV